MECRKKMTVSRISLAGLFLAFFKIGLFSFGGGYAMIPIIEKEVVVRRRWLEPAEFMRGISLTECIPGAVAGKIAVFVGTRTRGWAGAVAAALGIVLPSFFTLLAIAKFFNNLQGIVIIKVFIDGVKPVVAGLIMVSAFSIGRRFITDRTAIVYMVVGFLAVIVLGIRPIMIIWAAAVSRICLLLWPNWVRQKEKGRE
ncbi:MAG: chromate transporter [bacterium]